MQISTIYSKGNRIVRYTEEYDNMMSRFVGNLVDETRGYVEKNPQEDADFADLTNLEPLMALIEEGMVSSGPLILNGLALAQDTLLGNRGILDKAYGSNVIDLIMDDISNRIDILAPELNRMNYPSLS